MNQLQIVSGRFNVQGSITASKDDLGRGGDISASGYITATNITASGDISASGAIYGFSVYTPSLFSNTDITYTADADANEVGQHIFRDKSTVLATIDETGASFIRDQ